MSKKDKEIINFSKKLDDVFPELYIKEKLEEKEERTGKKCFLEITSNWIDWRKLKEGKQKLCVSVYDENGDCNCMGLTLKQIEKVEKYLKKAKRIIKELEETEEDFLNNKEE